MIVVSDTTAITTLLKAGREELLRDLFGDVVVPKAVWDELHAFHAQVPDFVLLRPVANAGRLLPETQSLGRGEAEAIKLAKELNADLLLTDDLKARVVGFGLNIKCTGLLGVIVRARQSGKIASALAEIERLQTLGGLYLSDAVKKEALKLAGEII